MEETTTQVVLQLPDDIHKLCRTCMAVTDNLLCHDITLIELNKLTVAGNMLENCTSLHMFFDDGLPTSICVECARKLEIAYNFKIQCEQTDTNLREILNLPPKWTTDEIKQQKSNSEVFFLNNKDNNVNQSDQTTKGVTLHENDFYNNSNKIYINEEISLGTLLQQRLFLEETKLTSTFISLPNISGILQEQPFDTEEITSLIEERKTCTSDPDRNDLQIKEEIDAEKELYLCQRCNQKFEFVEDLITHGTNCPIIEHRENGTLLTNQSGLENLTNKYTKFEPVVKRGKNKQDVKEYTCDLCSKEFPTEIKLAMHFRRHAENISKEKGVIKLEHNDSNIENTCYICNESFDEEYILKMHLEEQHTNANIVHCEICSETFEGELKLIKHLRKHGILISVCKICYKRFDTVGKLKAHMITHKNKNIQSSFNCPICKNKFHNKQELRTHAIVHANEAFECKKCKRTFNNLVSFQIHEKKHTEPRYLCSICGKQYHSNVTLGCHIRTHNNEKPFACPHCKKGFSSRATLSVHKRIHSSFKPYVCSYCGYSCRQSGDLAMHTRTHTGDKPYKCTFPNCDRRFTTSSQRKEHYRRHTNERNHRCVICDKPFLESKTLKVHMLTHTGEKPHECSVCGRKFRRTHHLTNHMKGHKDHISLFTAAT